MMMNFHALVCFCLTFLAVGNSAIALANDASTRESGGPEAIGYVPLFDVATLPASIRLDRPLIAYEDYPFPNVAYGERWEADAFPMMPIYTIVPDWSQTRLTPAMKRKIDDIEAMIEAGQGEAAIAELRRDPLPNAAAEVIIARIYLQGKGGVTEDKDLGRAWMRDGAEDNPHLFRWLGRTEPDRDLKIHYYSKGLSRGCVGCAEPLLRMTTSHTIGEGRRARAIPVPLIPLDLAFRYALYATEIGDAKGPILLGLVHSNALAAERQDLPNKASTQTMAALEALSKHEYGSTQASWEQLDTGFVHGRLIYAAQLIELEEWAEAARAMLATDERGRLQKEVVELLMNRAPAGALSPAVNREFARRLHDSGYEEYTAAVAIITRDGLPYFWWRNNSLELHRPTRVASMADGYLKKSTQARVDRLMAAAKESPLTPSGIMQVASSQEAVGRATQCLSRAVNQPNATAYGNARGIIGCRRLVDSAWSVSTEVDFGLFSDSGFRDLLGAIRTGCPECRAAAVQQANAERQAEIRSRRARLDRWDESPAGDRTPAARSDREAMERAQARTDFIFNDLPPEQTVAIGGLTTSEARTYVELDRFYTAYKNRVRQVAQGAHGSRPNACDHWAYQTLPVCL